jgi:hypothetical protein
LVAIAGPSIVILGAVFSERFICEHLTDYVFIGLIPSSTCLRVETGVQRISHLLSMLDECINDLGKYYEQSLSPPGLNTKPVSSLTMLVFILTITDHCLFLLEVFPWFQSFPHGKTSVQLKYQTRLAINDYDKAVFLATLTKSSGKKAIVIVKFTPSYNKEAHSMLAALVLAPQLWFCERVDDAGGLYIVVMDYIKPFNFSPQNPKVSQCVARAIKHLHSHGYVFGDLRQPNILVTQDGSAMLIDFDWCGKKGEAQYPLDINLDNKQIAWHPGVSCEDLIEIEHDEHMYEQLTHQKL